ncbi:MAG: winged helix-turn-helix domain-containing protein [Rhodobacteraceae bacterium]|nr:winged helix-turn-helix domain-containing protein [Paracoccaceae bacterium]
MMNKVLKKVLLVSSDDILNKALIEQFELVKLFSFKVSQTLKSINKLFKPDLIIYNYTSNENQTLEITDWIKCRPFDCKLIILGVDLKTQIKTNIENLENCILIEKPFIYDFLEKAIVECLKESLSKVLYLDDIKFFPNQKIIVNAYNKEIRLTEKETEILLFLYDSANQIVSKETLLNKVWGYSEGVTTHTLETHLYHLRKKLDDDKIISTEKGGYCMSI